MSLTKQFIDTRELEHPEPMQMAMKVLQSLDDNAYLYMLHKKKPLPLIDLATENKFQVHTHEDNAQQWHILIAKNTTLALSELVDV